MFDHLDANCHFNKLVSLLNEMGESYRPPYRDGDIIFLRLNDDFLFMFDYATGTNLPEG